MKIRGLPKLILEKLTELGPVPRVELDKEFGNATKLTIGSLKSRHMVESSLVNGIPTISITELGREQLRPEIKFCSACGCTPCDCGWGNY